MIILFFASILVAFFKPLSYAIALISPTCSDGMQWILIASCTIKVYYGVGLNNTTQFNIIVNKAI